MATLTYDPHATIRAFALSDTALVAHISNRLYYPSIPETDQAFPAIAYQILGGPYSQYIPMGRFTVEFRCFSSRDKTPREAMTTFGYLFNAIHDKQNITVADVESAAGDPIVLWSKCTSSAQPLTDPFTHWTFNRSLFEICITHSAS